MAFFCDESHRLPFASVSVTSPGGERARAARAHLLSSDSAGVSCGVRPSRLRAPQHARTPLRRRALAGPWATFCASPNGDGGARAAAGGAQERARGGVRGQAQPRVPVRMAAALLRRLGQLPVRVPVAARHEAEARRVPGRGRRGAVQQARQPRAPAHLHGRVAQRQGVHLCRRDARGPRQGARARARTACVCGARQPAQRARRPCRLPGRGGDGSRRSARPTPVLTPAPARPAPPCPPPSRSGWRA